MKSWYAASEGGGGISGNDEISEKFLENTSPLQPLYWYNNIIMCLISAIV
jgi:hypothetical protein